MASLIAGVALSLGVDEADAVGVVTGVEEVLLLEFLMTTIAAKIKIPTKTANTTRCDEAGFFAASTAAGVTAALETTTGAISGVEDASTLGVGSVVTGARTDSVIEVAATALFFAELFFEALFLTLAFLVEAIFLAGAAFLATTFLADSALFLTVAFLATTFLAGAAFFATEAELEAAFFGAAFCAGAAFFAIAFFATTFLAGAAFLTTAFFVALFFASATVKLLDD